MAVVTVGAQAGIWKELGQSTPANNSDTALYTAPSTGKGAINIVVSVANVTTVSLYRLWVDKAAAGTHFYKRFDVSLAAAAYDDVFIGGIEPADIIYVRTSVASALTFTANGVALG